MIIIVDIFASTVRWSIGFSIGCALALAIASISTLSMKIHLYSTYIFDFLRSIPILAIVPLVLYYAGPFESSKVFIISYATFFPVLVSILMRVRVGSEERLRFFTGLNLDKRTFWRAAIMPYIFEGLRSGIVVSIGIAWVSVVAAELLGTYSDGVLRGGLGYRIQLMYNAGDISGMWLYVLLFGFLGFASSSVAARLTRSRQTV